MLLLRPDHIGDVLLSAPAVALLRASLPDARLTYVVGPWSDEAARRGPPVDRVRTLVYPGFTRRSNANLVAPYVRLLVEAARLRRQRFDLAVVFRPDHWWGALLALLAGIPLRVGGATPETSPLLTHTYSPVADEPAAEQALGIARLALATLSASPVVPPAWPPRAFTVRETARAAATGLLARAALHEHTIVAIQPSAGAPLKSWPVANWARLADSLIDQGRSVLLVGAPADGPLLAAIQARMANPVATAHGQSLEISAAVYERCALLVTVDGGAGHLAAAVGTPTVRLYGPAPPSVFGPWPPRDDQRVLITHRLACAPCGHLEAPPCGATALPACLLALDVAAVLESIERQLGQQ